MLGRTLVGFAAVWITIQAPKPPESKYDAKRDVTIYSTGDIRTAGYSGYGARYEFPGKTPSVPTSVAMGFGVLRLTHDQPPEKDQESLHWNEVKTISLTYNGKTQEFPADHTFKVSTNQQVNMFLGRALEESLSISVTLAQFKDIAAADALEVHLGKDIQVIKGKSLGPLKRLAACLPPS